MRLGEWVKKSGTKCSICCHREASNIDLALSRGVSVTALSRRYKVSTDSLYRHSNNHLPPQLRAKLIAGPDLAIDLDKLRETESQSLLANLVGLRHRLFASLDTAEECGDGGMVTRVASALHTNLELTGKAVGRSGRRRDQCQRADYAAVRRIESRAGTGACIVSRGPSGGGNRAASA